MGTYLSTPVLEKGEESGHFDNSLAWGVVDMQGWRKSMEDAHVAETSQEFHVFAVFDGHGGPEVARFCQLYIVDVLIKQSAWQEKEIGLALIHAFHALDRMIDDMNRREELIALRTSKPPYSERRTTDAIPIPPCKQYDMDSMEIITTSDPTTITATDQFTKTTEATTHNLDDDSNERISADHDPSDQDLMLDEDQATTGTNEDKDEEKLQAVSNLLQQQLILPKTGIRGTIPLDGQSNELANKLASSPAPTSKPRIIASITQNGRQICNLPDHTIHAGCTAIVVVMVGRTLTVANAGDSRAVLCRAGGTTQALSLDHKPQQEGELARIKHAGGFVNAFGRVNGNLNLSRSIGDLKYKQVIGLTPKEQMITAEPDIVQVELHDKDEFIILGCDGIWDCLTNEQAVTYVRDRIDAKTPVQIGIEMLDEIISEDPRATQGIGGDNMTIMIIDLQPQTRSYR